MSVAQKTKGEGRFQGNRHEFQGKSNEKFRKPEGKSRLTMDGRCGDTSGNAVEFPILLLFGRLAMLLAALLSLYLAIYGFIALLKF